MAELYGRELTRQEIFARAGALSQLAGTRLMTLTGGKEQGVRVADVRTGSGLRFQVSLDRGMDISLAEYRGIPLAWRSPNGDVHPSYFDPVSDGWGRTFPGGLLTTCGLSYLGAPCVDEGKPLGLHGRISHTPATRVSFKEEWRGDECVFSLEGDMRESAIFRENLLLSRTIETRLGASQLTVRDRISNEGSFPAPLMVLYHINAGWPIVSEVSRLLLRSRAIRPRDEEAARGKAEAQRFCKPTRGYREQVFYHDLVPDEEGFAAALIHAGHLGLFVRYRQKELPRYVEWKMMGEGEYVVGMEPANCGVGGRAEERAAGTLQFLQGGEHRDFLLTIGVIEGEDALEAFAETHHLKEDSA
jgi:hypothetical protein